jgi:hypothetical protein
MRGDAFGEKVVLRIVKTGTVVTVAVVFGTIEKERRPASTLE